MLFYYPICIKSIIQAASLGRVACIFVVFLIAFSTQVNSSQPYPINVDLEVSDTKLLLNSVKGYGPFDSIMDLGGRFGRQLKWIHEQYPKAALTYVEPNPLRFYEAKDFAKELNEHVRFELTDAMSMDLGSTYDLIFSVFYMHWIDKQKQISALQNVYRHLNDEGIFAGIISPAKPAERPFKIAFYNTLSKPEYSTLKEFKDGRSLYTLDEYKQLLEQAGFVVLEIGYILRFRTFESPEKMQASINSYLMTGNEHFFTENQKLKRDFLTDLVDSFTQRTGHDWSDDFIWPVEIIRFIATKK